MKILFYQRSDMINSSGGTEKVLCNYASIFSEKKKYKIFLMTNENKKGKPFFKISNKVNFINIGGTKFKGLKKLIFKIIKSTFLLNLFPYFNNDKYTSDIIYDNIIKINPDIIILANPSDLYELCYSHTYNIPIIQMIHNVPWNIFKRKSKRILKKTLELMKNISVCQVLMNSYVELMKNYYTGKTVVIPNIVPTFSKNQVIDYYKKKKSYTIINIARINEIKNQKLLVNSFIKIANKYKNWNINIWGNKGDKEYINNIKKIIKKNNLENRIILKGTTDKPLKEFQKADICVFPSIFEGFPLSLTEAMSVGLPSIGLKTATGVNEIIINNKNGFLINNSENELIEKLEILINNVQMREKLGLQAKKDMETYNQDFIIKQWEMLIKNTISNYKK